MADEEGEHRRRLLELYQAEIRRAHSADPPPGRARLHPPQAGLADQPLNIDEVRNLAESMETETQRFYRRAAARSEDVSVRKLLGDLAEAEVEHERMADELRRRESACQRPSRRR